MLHYKQLLGHLLQHLDAKSLGFTSAFYLAGIWANFANAIPVIVGMSTILYNGVRIYLEFRNRKKQNP
jgi:hypothetical protein